MQRTGRGAARIVVRLLVAALLAGSLLTGGAAEAATRPSPPRMALATPLDHAVRVTWRAPLRSGGAAVDRYAVQRWNPTNQRWVTIRTTGPAARSWVNTGLPNGITFYYRVLAHNRVGWSAPSRQLDVTPRALPGGVPYLEADTHDAELRPRWGNAVANGAVVDHYAVQISTDGATWRGLRKVTTLTTSYTGLVPGTRYWLRVRAHNAAGYGPSGGAGPYRAYTTPAAVQSLTVAAGDGQATLDWDAPAADVATGRPAASEYLVEISADGGATWTSTTTTPTPGAVLTGLTNGTTYTFRVSARPSIANIGYGPTATVTTDPAVGVPGRPSDLTATPELVETLWQVALAWAAPSDGSAATSYRVERSDDDGTTWSDLGEVTDPSYVDTTVAPESTYRYRVVAVGPGGNGEPSTDQSVVTGPIGP